MGIIGWTMMGFAYGMVVGMLITLVSFKMGLRAQRKEKELFEKLDLKLCGLDKEECEECHLPGDCPLCGAE